MRSSRFAHAAPGVRSHARGVHAAAALEHARLREELETVRAKLRRLEADNPALAAEQQKLDGLLASHAAENPELRSDHNRSDGFSPPKLHHINIVSRECDRLLHFYRDVMRMDEMPIEMFPRNAEGSSGQGGSNVPICFTTDGHMQMHLATQDLGVAQRRASRSTRSASARSVILRTARTTSTRSRRTSIRAASRTATTARASRATGTRSSSLTRRA